MYQSYPTSGQPQQPQLQQPPGSVVNAVRLMYAGAALSALGIAISLLTIGSLKKAIEKSVRARTPNVTTTQLHAAQAIGIGSVIVVALLAVGLWLWMAWANRKGRNWARIVSSVLFAINTLDVFVSLAQPHAAAGTIFSVVIWLVGLGAIVLIWNKQSAPFYHQQPI
jgi:hypothetical protein